MGHFFSTIFILAGTQLKRSFRDPMTLLVLFAIPILLLVIFGAFLRDTSNIKLRVAVVNNSAEPYAKDFEKSLSNVKVLKLPEERLSLNEARDKMSDDELDGIIELPASFGAAKNNVPQGTLKVYYDQTDTQTGDIVASVMQNIVDGANRQFTDVKMPLAIERTPINVTQVSAFDGVFAMFTGLAIMMVGVFGVASAFPADKKTGALRRLHLTPLKPGQVMLGTMLSFAVIGVIAVALMTSLALTAFSLDMRGDWLTYSIFIIAALVMMLGFGLTIGGLAKNTTQSDLFSQIVFLASLALSGVWFPRALMPEFLQNITAFLPLTPVVDGIRHITTEGLNLAALTPELAVIGGWILVVYVIGARVFRWE